MILRCFCFLSLMASPVLAEVIDAGDVGFTSRTTIRIEASQAEVWLAAVDDVSRWWNPAHTVSGDATRLTISAIRQGCFCEDFGEDAGVVHLTATTAIPPSMLRLSGGLGPLGLMGVHGNMTWEFVPDGNATIATFTYAVGGYRDGGLADLAVPVDAVLAEALGRLKAHSETKAEIPQSGDGNDPHG